MNYFAMPGVKHTSKDFIITNDQLIIGCYAMLPSGEIRQVTDHSQIEQLTDQQAKLVRLKQSSMDTVGKKLKQSFRPMVDLGSAFENFKRGIIFKHNIK